MTRDIQTIQFIGHCYDPLYLDRRRLTDLEPHLGQPAAGVKSTSPFQREHSETLQGIVPTPSDLTHLASINSTSVDEATNVISSSYEYKEKISASVKMSVGVEGLFTSERGTEWEQIKERIEKHDETTVLTTGYRRLFALTLDLNEIDRKGGRVPELTKAFKTTLQEVAEGDDAAFETFVRQYGTHFAAKLVMGGAYEQEIRINEKEMTRLEANNVNVSAEAKISLEKIEVGSSVESSVELSQTWRDFYKKETRRVRMWGGEPAGEATVKDWLPTVLPATAAVVEVTLVAHHKLMAKAYFGELSDTKRRALQESLEKKTLTYFEKHGVDLGLSRVHGGDVVYIVPLKVDPGVVDNSVETPDMLMQPRASKAQVVVGNLKEPSLSKFKENCLSNSPLYAHYKPYLWRVLHAENAASKAEIRPGDLFRLVNLDSGRNMDSQGLRDNKGSVSAATDIPGLPLGSGTGASDLWTMRPSSPGAPSNIALDSGARMAFYRTYASPNPLDPKGSLRIYEGKAFSNGSNALSPAQQIQFSCAYRLVKVS